MGHDRNEGAPDADAVIRFGGTRDQMKLCVSFYTPARGKGRPLSVEFLRETLKAKGVVAEMDDAAAADAVRLLSSGQGASHIAIVQGTPPREPKDAALTLHGDPNLPVFPGMVFGKVRPAEEGGYGLDVAGNAVPPKNPGPPRALACGQGQCRVLEDGSVEALGHGLVSVSEGQVLVAPQIALAEDFMTAKAVVYGRDLLGDEITVERLAAELSRMGVVFGVRLDAIKEALDRAKAENRPQPGVTLAVGKPPLHGLDGRLETFFVERSSVGITDDQGRIDFRNRGVCPVVSEGDPIARLHPPTKGVAGKDILGRDVQARDGTALTMHTGPNVETLEDGRLFKSRINGTVILRKDLLDVSDLLDVPGDVDLSSGNIHMDKGSVRVKGNVLTGFEVRAPHNVIVDGMVESARISAGGDISVKGGIFMSGDASVFVQAGGTVSAAYTHNARVLAGADIVIAHYVTSSRVQAGFRVRAGGQVRITDPKGRIVGGTVVAAEGIEVFEAGSSMGAATVLAINSDTPESWALVQEKRQLKELLDRALKVLGEGDGRAALAKLPESKLAEAMELLARRPEAEARLKEISTALTALAEDALNRSHGAQIIVRGTIHPGVTIKMGGRAMLIERPMQTGRFIWDQERREILVAGL